VDKVVAESSWETVRGMEASKLSHREDVALVALLTEATIANAAQRVGVGEATIYRWLQQPDFQAKYRAVRRQLLENAITQLQSVAGEAVGTLVRNLYCGHAPTEVRAAMALLGLAVKSVELIDTQERLAALEDALTTRERNEE
jgi:transposase-like protein